MWEIIKGSCNMVSDGIGVFCCIVLVIGCLGAFGWLAGNISKYVSVMFKNFYKNRFLVVCSLLYMVFSFNNFILLMFVLLFICYKTLVIFRYNFDLFMRDCYIYTNYVSSNLFLEVIIFLYLLYDMLLLLCGFIFLYFLK